MIGRRIARCRRTEIRRSYQVGSSAYADALEPTVGSVATSSLRAAAVGLVRSQSKSDAWYNDPIRTLKSCRPVQEEDKVVETLDAMGNVNGLACLSDFEAAKGVCTTAPEIRLASHALKDEIRSIEEKLFDPAGDLAPQLIANQALDFYKQDGVTEIEEALQASEVERRLNDLLLQEEVIGKIHIDRRPAVVLCVANFTNFLDLSRKVLRNLEVGTPVIVFHRNGTASQHVYRWSQLLAHEILLKEETSSLPISSLFHFICCDLETQRNLLFEVLDTSPTYLTGSRAAAHSVKQLARRCFASCGGPNTMILCADKALETSAFATACRDSAFIEQSGQCTALRHLIAPGATTDTMERYLLEPPGREHTALTASAVDALENGQFSALLPESPSFSDDKSSPGAPSLSEVLKANGYSVAGDRGEHLTLGVRDARDRVAWRVNQRSAPQPDDSFEEHWRRVVIDVTSPPSRAGLMDEGNQDAIAAWLLAQQPISVCINKVAVIDHEALEFARRVWERTACVVFSVGDVLMPATTAQARPQDGEIFGEVPPRSLLDTHTAAPVFVPSATPAYAASYSADYLELLARDFLHGESLEASSPPPGVAAIVRACDNIQMQGYCLAVWKYLEDAAIGPRRGVKGANRDTLWGLQRPPLGKRGATWLRVSANDSFDACAPVLTAFTATNAAAQLRISVHPNSGAATKIKEALGNALLDSAFARNLNEAHFENEVIRQRPWNVVRTADFSSGAQATAADVHSFGLASHLITRLFPFGHVKSTRPDDPTFRKAFADSPKWLRAAARPPMKKNIVA